eukprot:TRINITY_DN1889_c0_g1_i2.p1 TRINITY_DN1889_c0_g1~~TRINITY_DN1889_c0_g1_i2.p1  ORF type:complete len:196 (+),score=25.90 TRINITY_DN1889_c0_g1_i2:40-627(+)
MAQLFDLTTKFKASIKIMNEIDNKPKFHFFLLRIVRTLHQKNEAAFNETEEQQLSAMFNVESDDIHALLEACSFIFEQCVYYNVSSNVLAQQLEASGIDPILIKSFHKLWEDEKDRVVSNFRERTLLPQTLETINWSLHLQMAQSNLSRTKTPNAIFEFGFRNWDNPKEVLVMFFIFFFLHSILSSVKLEKRRGI